ncbi:MAG: 3-deoxy-D-manno-octulosonic acid transferase [Chitinophagaceae bacterium]|nr:MAG: 3-deoxy-D-manno-octulosonic acid transferase [Chitinophagaceae bacterium]
MLLLYNIFIRLYYVAICLASLWNKKAGQWREGRKQTFQELASKIVSTDRMIWVHCSSAGEFEQGKPVIEALKQQYPHHKILVSFFSPSGYDVAKRYPHADFITYLPLDTRKNAQEFVKLVHPELVIFVKYEFWYHHLATAAFRHIPILLISATFRKEQLFFKSYGRFFRQILFLFRHIFVQDNSSLEILQANDFSHSSIGGDTRFDRVTAIASNFSPIPFIENSLLGCQSIVAGSTWKHDEEILKELGPSATEKLVIAPHEIDEAHLKEIHAIFPGAVYFSSLKEGTGEKNSGDVIIIDNVGMLSRLYQYATITYIGGGFTKDGIHNILEAAVWGKPVIFGPNYHKYREAKELIAAGGGFSINNAQELKQLADKLLSNEQYLQAVGENARKYVLENTGATQKILQAIQAKRLLTN